MDLIKKLNNSYKIVVNNSKYVKINYDKVDEMIDNLDCTKLSYWLDSNPYELMNMDVESIINFLLIYHTIGDYCFWGNPKWEIDTENGKMDGSYAIMYLIINRFKNNTDFNMNYEEFSDFLKGNVEIPLLNDRYNNLVIMNEFIKDKSFYQVIKNITSDSELFEFVISMLPYFEDKSTYKENEILFYKRAQLLVSDILHVREKKENIVVDYSHLIGCADYKIPQVMRCFKMLEFSDDLVNKIDNNVPLEEGSIEEIEIRANTLAVINYIYEKLNEKYTRMDINDFIWLLSQDKTKMIYPYHKTLTKHY